MSLHGRPFLRRGPSGPLAVGAAREIVQAGYDQSTVTMTVGPTAGAPFPRAANGDPLKVVLEDVTPGNFLEIDWRLNLEAALGYLQNFPFKAIAILTLDGSVPSVPSVPANTTFYVADSGGASYFVNFDTETPDQQSLSALALVQVPTINPKTGLPFPDFTTLTVTVELLYITTGDVTVGGATTFLPNGLSSILKVWELAGDSTDAATGVSTGIVSQAGPGNLVSAT